MSVTDAESVSSLSTMQAINVAQFQKVYQKRVFEFCDDLTDGVTQLLTALNFMAQLVLVGIHHFNGAASLIARTSRTDNRAECLGDAFGLVCRFADTPDKNFLAAK